MSYIIKTESHGYGIQPRADGLLATCENRTPRIVRLNNRTCYLTGDKRWARFVTAKTPNAICIKQNDYELASNS